MIRPGPQGAHNWHPMSFNPRTGLVYLPTQELPFEFTTESPFTVRRGFWNTGVSRRPLSDDPAVRAAIKTGSLGGAAWPGIQWRKRRYGGRRAGVRGTAERSRRRVGSCSRERSMGSSLPMDAASGKELWSHDNQAATLAGPISYEIDGEQYVAVLAGNGSVFYLTAGFLAPSDVGPVKGRVYVFKIGGTAPKPALDRVQAARTRAAIHSHHARAVRTRGAALRAVLRHVSRRRRHRGRGGSRSPAVTASRRRRGVEPHRVQRRARRPRHARVLGTSDAADAELIRAYVARQAARQ